ncbi:hypothetical protein ACJX0J_013421, partial [Zea mays]
YVCCVVLSTYLERYEIPCDILKQQLASFSHIPLCTEKVNKGNDIATIVEHISDLPLSHDDCLLCDDNAIIFMPLLKNKLDIVILNFMNDEDMTPTYTTIDY